MAYKTLNNVYKDFKTFVETALAAEMEKFPVITGWHVKKLHQTIKTEDLKPSVYIQRWRKHQAGAQYWKTGSYIKTYSSRQEISIRFSASRRFLIGDTVETINASDVLSKINAYFQSLEGIKMLAAENYAQYRASDVQEQSFTNDDGNIQIIPFFECDYLYTDSWQTPVNKIDKVKMKLIKGV